MKARGWNRAFHAAHGNTLIELLFLLVGMLVLSVSGAASAKMPSSEQLDFAATGRVKERSLDARMEMRAASPSCVDSTGWRPLQNGSTGGSAGCESRGQRRPPYAEHNGQSDGKARCMSSGQRQRTVEERCAKAGGAAERESRGQRQQTFEEYCGQADGKARCVSSGQHQRTVEERRAKAGGAAECESHGQRQQTLEEYCVQSDGQARCEIGRAHV